MTSYLVTIATDHHGTCRKMRARDELTATSSGADVLSSGKKKTQKIGRGGGGGTGGIHWVERVVGVGGGNGWHPLGARFLFHSIWWCFPLFEF